MIRVEYDGAYSEHWDVLTWLYRGGAQGKAQHGRYKGGPSWCDFELESDAVLFKLTFG